MISQLPDSVPLMQRSAASLQDPLWRCYDREMGHGKSLLKVVRADLERLKGACEGNVKTTNDIRQMIADLNTDSVPASWKKYAVADITVTAWLADFIARLEQLAQIKECSDLQKFKLWFGGLFFPEAFLTATRQAVAQKLGVSLEELLLVTYVGSSETDGESFLVKGLYMEGATWDQKSGVCGQLTTTDELFVALPDARLKWARRDSPEYKSTQDYFKIAVYLNTARNLLVTSFNLQAPKDIPSAIWMHRSACITLWTKT